jgi:hypothetical protein
MLYGVIGIIASIALVNIISGIMFHTLSQRDCREKEYGLQEA